MPKVQEYNCGACGAGYEFLHHPSSEPALCPTCGSSNAELRPHCARPFSTIIATSLTSKAYKAGYVHSHGKRPAEKISSSVPRSFKP